MSWSCFSRGLNSNLKLLWVVMQQRRGKDVVEKNVVESNVVERRRKNMWPLSGMNSNGLKWTQMNSCLRLTVGVKVTNSISSSVFSKTGFWQSVRRWLTVSYTLAVTSHRSPPLSLYLSISLSIYDDLFVHLTLLVVTSCCLML